MSASSSSSTPKSGHQASRPDPDDMNDTPADLARWPQLAASLQVCAQMIEPAFRKSDGAALRHQRIHREIVKFATVFTARTCNPFRRPSTGVQTR